MIKLKAKAKINLGLWIEGKYPDGYHKLSTLLLPIDLWDSLDVEKADETKIKGPNFGTDDFMYRAINILEKESGKSLPLQITIEKKIPIGAGLAGGTADGACVLHALNNIYNLGYDLQGLQRTGKDLGADLAYCLLNEPTIGRGRGDDLEQVKYFPNIHCLILNPGFSISTKDAYSWIKEYSKEPDFSRILSILKNKDYCNLKGIVKNDLEKGVVERYPQIEKMKEELYEYGADFALMSGSGPSVYGLFSDENKCSEASLLLKDKYKMVIKSSVLGGIENE